MECSPIKKKLSAYADGELPLEDADVVRAHINECAACREELNFIISLKKSIINTRQPFFAKIINTAATPDPNFNLWPLVKSKLSQPSTRFQYKEDIFEKFAYKFSLAGAMLLYLSAEFDPVLTTLFWFYFLYHLVVYAQKFDTRQSLIKI